MCTYHGITMHNDIAINFFYYVFFALCLIMILLWVVCTKHKNYFIFDQSGLENTFFVLVYFNRPLDSWNIPIQTQLLCSSQTDQTLTCSSYNITINEIMFGTMHHISEINKAVILPHAFNQHFYNIYKFMYISWSSYK